MNKPINHFNVYFTCYKKAVFLRNMKKKNYLIICKKKKKIFIKMYIPFSKIDNDFQFKIRLCEIITYFISFKKLNVQEFKLLSNYSDIKKLIKTVKLKIFKILYFNKINIHKILYDSQNIISIDDCNISLEGLDDLFYSNLLIMENPNIINYDSSIDIIRKIDKYIKTNYFLKYKIVILSKININLIHNYIETDIYKEEEEKELSIIKNNCITNIRNNFKEININLDENEIIKNKVDIIYIKIINELIKSSKVENYEYTYNIIKEIDLESIYITKAMFDEMYKILNPREKYMEKYIISQINDLININKINFYYILLKYILKYSIYIYYIPILLKLKKTIINIIKYQLNNFLNLIKNEDNIIIEKIEYIVDKITDSKYYFQKYISNFKLVQLNEILYYYKEFLFESKKEDINKIERIIKNKEINKYDTYLYDYEKAKKMNKRVSIIKYLFNSKEENKNYNNSNKKENELNKYIEEWNIIEKMIKEKKYKKMRRNTKIQLINYFSDIKNKNIILTIFKEDEYYLFIKENIKYLDLKNNKEENKENKDNKNTINNVISTKNNSIIKSKPLESFNINQNQNNNNKIQDSSIIIQSYTIDNNASLNKKSNIVINDKNETETIFDLNVEYSELLNLYQKSSKYIVIEFIKIIGNHQVADFIKNIDNGLYISGGENKKLIIYDSSFKNVLEIELDKMIYNIEVISITQNYIKIVAYYLKGIFVIKINCINMIYKIDKIENFEVGFSCYYILQSDKDNVIILGKNGISQCINFFKENVDIIGNKILLNDGQNYKEGLKINNNIFCFKSNSIVPKGSNTIIFYDINKQKILENIKGYSFTISPNGLCLISNKELNKNYKILLCACKKYDGEQKNGILLVIINLKKEKEKFYYSFYDTQNYEVNCFCPILNVRNENIIDEDITVKDKIKIDKTDFFLVGGFNEEKREGSIRLYKIINNENLNEIKIMYIQDIIIDNDIFEGFQMPISCITQSTISGNIIISCWDGNVCLFKPPNIDYYLNSDKK